MNLRRFLKKAQRENHRESIFEQKSFACDGVAQFVFNIANANSYSIEKFDRPDYFDNLMFIVTKDSLIYRFIRDRGFTICEIGDKNRPDVWRDYDFKMLGITVNQYDFCEVVDKVLSFSFNRK